MEAHVIRHDDQDNLESWIAVDIPDEILIAWIHRLPISENEANTWVVYGNMPATRTTRVSDSAFALWKSWLDGMMRDTWPGPGRPKVYLQKAYTMASKVLEKERAAQRKITRTPVTRNLNDEEWQRVLQELNGEK